MTKNLPSKPQSTEAEILAYKRGNTVLLETLMNMADQYLSHIEGEICRHGFMSAGENALMILEEAGMAKSLDDTGYEYELLWDNLNERKKLLGVK